ncbi:resolvase-like protein [Rathayibacter iranicus]|uniref:Resolvase-like protein n=1 Tax=Rathayibacter iranicus NCPPB 2253 = VKM Ac-1602 TaxID=1328868 RepID=A0ABX5LA68_9MICO|nr:resolvase-like protein [Rathayibacter iranicus] [Rathayibacter iranicus NCPPB 2253 = VKM Ac-1602]
MFPSQNEVVRLLGYTRVSTSSQDVQLQVDALVAAGVQKRDVFADVMSGSKTAIVRRDDGEVDVLVVGAGLSGGA